MENLEERRLTDFFFADVVSYSRLIQKNELKKNHFLKLINQNYLILEEG